MDRHSIEMLQAHAACCSLLPLFCCTSTIRLHWLNALNASFSPSLLFLLNFFSFLSFFLPLFSPFSPKLFVVIVVVVAVSFVVVVARHPERRSSVRRFFRPSNYSRQLMFSASLKMHQTCIVGLLAHSRWKLERAEKKKNT